MNQLGFYLLLLVLVIFFIILGSFAFGGILAAPWVPVRRRDIKRILDVAKIKKGDILYDLGCGDGRIVISAARYYNIAATGYEVAVLPFLYTWIKIKLLRLSDRAAIKMANFYEHDIGGANIIFTFLSPRAMEKLKNKFKKELKSGSLVVSYVFKIPGWEPLEVNRPQPTDLPIFVYKI